MTFWFVIWYCIIPVRILYICGAMVEYKMKPNKSGIFVFMYSLSNDYIWYLTPKTTNTKLKQFDVLICEFWYFVSYPFVLCIYAVLWYDYVLFMIWFKSIKHIISFWHYVIIWYAYQYDISCKNVMSGMISGFSVLVL